MELQENVLRRDWQVSLPLSLEQGWSLDLPQPPTLWGFEGPPPPSSFLHLLPPLTLAAHNWPHKKLPVSPSAEVWEFIWLAPVSQPPVSSHSDPFCGLC